jgi:hypothetical protein
VKGTGDGAAPAGAGEGSGSEAVRDGVLAGVLAAAALVIWLPYEVHAFFMLDDFPFTEHYVLSTTFYNFRPLFHLLYTICFECFGTSPRGYYVLLCVLMAGNGALLFLCLRRLGVALAPALLAGGIVIAYPRADALGLWWSASQMSLALCLGLLGVLLGAVWVGREGRALAWLVPSVIALVASILSYEALVPIFLLPVCLVAFSSNRRRLFVNAGIDAVAVGAAALYMLHRATGMEPRRAISTYPARSAHLVADGWRALFAHGFFAPTGVGLAIAFCMAGAAAVVMFILRRRSRTTEPGPWRPAALSVPLLIAATFLGWSAYVPASDWYDPLLLNIGNHVNTVAQIFFITALSLLAWLAVRAVTARWRSPLVATVGVGLVGVVLVGGFVGHVLSDQQQFTTASTDRQGILKEIRHLDPSPAPGDNFALADFHRTVGSTLVDVFETTWDTGPAVELLYRTATLRAEPLTQGAVCGAHGLSQPGYPDVTTPYSKLKIVDVGRHRIDTFADRAQCAARIAALAASTPPLP